MILKQNRNQDILFINTILLMFSRTMSKKQDSSTGVPNYQLFVTHDYMLWNKNSTLVHYYLSPVCLSKNVGINDTTLKSKQ